MPLYEYRCEGCGERFEVLQRMGEAGDGLACPACGAARPARQLSTFAAAAGGGGGAREGASTCCRAPSGFS
jgi:putative FmdB family regulatory protein